MIRLKALRLLSGAVLPFILCSAPVFAQNIDDATSFGTIPNIAPFQTLMIHPSTVTNGSDSTQEMDSTAADEPLVVFGTVPGEPTSVVGERIASQIAQVFGPKFPRERVAVVGLANSYLGYFTTPAEYRAQHYGA